MNRWAASGRFDCHFLCVCVVGDPGAVHLCKEMSQEMKLTHVVNGYIDNERDMPNYGQLGCSGFIILDPDHHVVSPCTSAFMEVRDLAFKHVEALLDSLCSKRPLPPFCPGEQVQLVEAPPSRPDLKNVPGICVALEGADAKVALMAGPMRGKIIQIKASALKLFGADTQQPACSSGGCKDGPCSTGKCSDGPCSTGKCGDGKKSCSSPCDMDDDRASNSTTDTVLDEDFVAAHLDIVSVKVPSMDDEHGECAEALSNLARQRTRLALQAALDTIQDHFIHEESLFKEFNFGEHADERFSARKSHMEDHARIIRKFLDQLREVASKPDQARCVPVGFVKEVLQDFHQHTSKYDASYADFLSSKGAK
eukprot:TRINITY_DN2181_c0_g2_i1.p1 TRINITY_DN2181_c0_g2~~TRINITY_DN2181_c0_g2_i1.p1  ORF type:complete len:366 (+),score=44.40 TRINITY_DN2181_c0_g2_i1:226-1323(+)